MAKIAKAKAPKVPTTLQLVKLVNANISRSHIVALNAAMLRPFGAGQATYSATDTDVTITVGLDVTADRETLVNPKAMVAAFPLVPPGASLTIRCGAPMRGGAGNCPEHPDDKAERETREAAELATRLEREAANRAKVQADRLAAAAARGDIPAGPVIALAPITPDGTESRPVTVPNVDNATRMDSWCAIHLAPPAARGVAVPSWDLCAPQMSAAVWCAALGQALFSGAAEVEAEPATVAAPPPDGYMATPPVLGNVIELAASRPERWQPGMMRAANDDGPADLGAIAARAAPWYGVAGYGDD